MMADENPPDDASAEGAVFQSLFDNDSDSDSLNDDDDYDDNNNEIKTSRHPPEEAPSSPTETDVFVTRSVLHVEIVEQQVGGGIAHRLWPPAELLATFVVDCAHGKDMKLTSNDRRQPDDNLPQQILETLRQSLQRKSPILLELGAGLGLTGLEIATQIDNTNVLFTELEEGLPLLRRNLELNRHSFRGGMDAGRVQKFAWGDEQDCQEALDWYRSVVRDNNDENDDQEQPLLILASDCVYWEACHKPFELALHGLLSRAPPTNSMCLIAGIRRWKRDNTFYQTLGRHTRTKTHELRCTLLQETIRREEESRMVLRIYAVQWVPLSNR